MDWELLTDRQKALRITAFAIPVIVVVLGLYVGATKAYHAIAGRAYTGALASGENIDEATGFRCRMLHAGFRHVRESRDGLPPNLYVIRDLEARLRHGEWPNETFEIVPIEAGSYARGELRETLKGVWVDGEQIAVIVDLEDNDAFIEARRPRC